MPEENPMQFPFVVDGLRGDVPTNFYPASDSERGVILYPTPGLLEHCQLTDCSEIRGILAWNNYLYVVARRGSQSAFWRVDGVGAFAELGTITTSASGPVWIKNNSTQILIVDGVSGYVYTPSSNVFVQVTDADFPGAGAADYLDGYGLFFTPGTNQWFHSELYDFLDFDALDFYTKESTPDNIRSMLAYARELYIFGVSKGTEVWHNYGGDNSSADNPTFARDPGGLIQHGCGAAASPSTMDGERVTWITDQGQLMQAVRYESQVVSSQMFDRALRGYASYSDAVAFSYRDQGHVFYQVSFPAADETWVLDGNTKVFHKRSSYKSIGGYGRHRANCYALLNGVHYVGDYTNGKVYKMSVDYLSDNGNNIQRKLYSREWEGGLNRLFFPPVQLIVEPGVGLVGGVAPQIGLEWSSDGGHNWSTMLTASAGATGDYGARAIWRQLGSGFRRMYRMTFTDPVVWKVLGIDWGGFK
jgi:hypothetical protein